MHWPRSIITLSVGLREVQSRTAGVTSKRVRPRSIALSRSYRTTRIQRQAGQSQLPPPSSSPSPEGYGGNDGPPNRFQIKPIHILLVIASAGLLAVYNDTWSSYFGSSIWPKSVRTPLRRALQARNLGDYDRSEGFFKEAIAAALALSRSQLDPDPLLKISGLYTSYAGMLEESHQKPKAYLVLREALTHFGSAPLSSGSSKSRALSPEDHIRVVGLVQKMGHLALDVSKAKKVTVYPMEKDGPEDVKSWFDAAAYHLNQAFEAMVKMGLKQPPAAGKNGESSPIVIGRDVELPQDRSDNVEGLELGEQNGVYEQGGSVNQSGMVMTMEALAEIYEKRGQHDLSAFLYIQILSILVPPGTKIRRPPSDQCHAARLMNNVCSQVTQINNSESNLKTAKTWADKAKSTAERVLADPRSPDYADWGESSGLCNYALASALFNLSMIADRSKDLDEAVRTYEEGLRISGGDGPPDWGKYLREKKAQLKAKKE